MAGYIIKVTMEGTHPPVWRRMVIPEKVSFLDLHCMIQVAFGWYDAHLHEFTFPDGELCVADPEVSDYDDIIPEKDTMVDDYLRSYRWIRYTYDFGDDWRHKIVFEKEDPSYSQRYGTVLKAKGENFEEDSGGVWGESQWDEPYDMQEANQVLAQMEFPVFKPSKGGKGSGRADIIPFAEKAGTPAQSGAFVPRGESMFGSEDLNLADFGLDGYTMEDFEAMMEGMDEDELEQAFQMMDQLYAIARRGKEFNQKNPPSSSPLGKIRAAWNRFCTDKESWTEWIKEEEEESILGCDDLLEGEGFFVEKAAPGHSWKDILCKASQQELRDYCKYLQIPWKKSWTKKKMVDKLLEFFQESPEYVLYVLEEGMFTELLKFCKAPVGQIPDLEDNGEGISRAIALGMAEIRTKETDISDIAYVKFSQEAQDFLLSMEKIDWKLVYKRLAEIDEKIRLLILSYGMLEVDVLYQMFCETWDMQVEQEEFLRILYWHCRFCGLIQSGQEVETGKAFVVPVDLDFEQIMVDRQRFGSDLEYPKFTEEEMQEKSELLVSEFSGWGFYGKYLIQVCGMVDNVAMEWIEMVIACIKSGDSTTQLMDGMFEIFQPSNLMEWTELWLCTMEICMETGLPMLKGYSRAEYAAMTGKPVHDMGLFDEDALEKVPQENIHLFELPAEMQCQLYYASRETDGSFVERVKEILQESKDNYEVAFLLMNGYMSRKKFTKAKNLALDLKKRLPERDPALEEALRYLKKAEKEAKGDGEWDPFYLEGGQEGAQVPYRREKAKVGRNDPCPCGSGKKYKNCCGKNK